MTAAASLEMKLPRQIRERVERGQKIMAELNAPQEGEVIEGQTPPEGEVVEAANPPAASADTTPAPPADLPDLQPFHDPGDDERFKDPNYWQRRVSVLQGFMRRDRAEFDTREAALRKKVSDLEGEIRAMKAGAPAPIELATILKPEQIEALGEEQATTLVTAAVTAARQHVDAALSQQKADAEARRAEDEQASHQRRVRAFFDALDEAAPGWREIDQRADWRAWLGETDANGMQRQAAIDDAKQNLDAVALAKIVHAFVQSRTARPQPPVAPPRNAGTPPAPVPGNTRDLSQIPPTKAETDAFYKRASVNGGRGVSDAERAAFEARLRLL